MIKVNSNLMTSEAEELSAIAGQTETISNAISKVNSNMKWNVSGSSAVRSKLQSYSSNLSTMSQSLSALSVVLVDSASAYENTENELCSTGAGSSWSNIETLIASGKLSSDVSPAVATIASTKVATDVDVQGTPYNQATRLALAMTLATELGMTDTVSIGMFDAISSFLDGLVGSTSEIYEKFKQFMETLMATDITNLVTKKTSDQIKEEIEERYKNALNNYINNCVDPVTSFKGECSRCVKYQLIELGILTMEYNQPAGKKWYSSWKSQTKTDTGYNVETYAGANALKDLIASYGNNETIENVVVSFDKGTNDNGHVLLISVIQDGYVYFAESVPKTVGKTEYAAGEMICCTVDEFLSAYSDMNGVVHFYQ